MLEWKSLCVNSVRAQILHKVALDEHGNPTGDSTTVGLPTSLVSYTDTALFPSRKIKYYISVEFPNTTIVSNEIVLETNNFYSFTAHDDQFIKAPTANKVIVVNRQEGKLIFFDYKNHILDSLVLGTSITGKCAVQEYNGRTELYAYSMQQQRILVVDVNQKAVIDNVPVAQQYSPISVLANGEKLYVVRDTSMDNLRIVRRGTKQIITTGPGNTYMVGAEAAVIMGDTSNDFLMMTPSYLNIAFARVNDQGKVYDVDYFQANNPIASGFRRDLFCQVVGTPFFVYGEYGYVYHYLNVTYLFTLKAPTPNSSDPYNDFCTDHFAGIYGAKSSGVYVFTSETPSYEYSHFIRTTYSADRIIVSDNKLYVFTEKGDITGTTLGFILEEIPFN